MNSVYMIRFDWRADWECDVEIELFNDYADARKRFEELIKNESDPEKSWAGKHVFNNGTKAEPGYELEYKYGNENSESFWNIVKEDDYDYHSFISLTKEYVK